MKTITLLCLLLSMLDCNTTSQKPGEDKTIRKEASSDTQGRQLPVPPVLNADTAYPYAEADSRLMVTGYYNEDDIMDSAFLLQEKNANAKSALYIRHGGTNKSFLFRDGKALRQDFVDFQWVGQLERIAKGTTIWNNVVNGEIVSEDQVPASKKIRLTTDAIFMHEEEGGGGGIVYYKDGKYMWVQQD